MAPPEVVSMRPCPPVPAVKERPILFSAPMVRALLDGSKTQTRRVVKPQPDSRPGMDCTRLIFKNRKGMPLLDEALEAVEPVLYRSLCPYGQPGDRLWVRETFAEEYDYCDHPEMPGAPTEHFHYGWHYRADGEPKRDEFGGLLSEWKPSIHMFRRASRIDLEVTGVRVERLQDISEADAIAEGIEKTSSGFWSLYGQADVDGTFSPRASYRALWESINGAGSWDANPWVWIVEFRRVRP